MKYHDVSPDEKSRALPVLASDPVRENLTDPKLASLGVVAYHLIDRIKPKELARILGGKTISSNSHELQLELGPSSYVFAYRFGSLVFVNVSPQKIEDILYRVRSHHGSPTTPSRVETYTIQRSQAILVDFESVFLKDFSHEQIRLIAMTVGQSASLEQFETQVEEMLDTASRFIDSLSKHGHVPIVSRKLLKMIGSSAITRQHIVSQLAVLDAPEETWENPVLESLFRDVQDNFEIHLRFKTLDKKLTLIQDNIEILAELSSSKRGHLLEALIVALIVLEIILAFAGVF